jgi:N-acetylneuraminic acid mutarotase
MLLDPILAALEEELRTGFDAALEGLLATARTRLECALAEVAQERANGLADIATQKDELRREVEKMHTHAEQQQGRVELNIGGYHFQTSVQSLRRVPHTFFDAYFSGRYAQDVCDDGSIFVDRDGEHFGHVLEYMRDGVVSVAAPGACPGVSLLRLLKREFGFYCIELVAEEPAEPEQLEMAFVMGGADADRVILSSMERYDASTGQWSAVAAMPTARSHLGACVMAGELYVTGGLDDVVNLLSSVEKYTPSSDTWSAVAPMPAGRAMHSAVAVGSAMYVLGGSSRYTLRFDGMQGTWSTVAPMPEMMLACATCAVGSDIYVFGGLDMQNASASVLKYDTVTDAWSTLAPMPQPCAYHSASVLGGLVYIVGAGTNVHEVLRFDPASGVWSTLAPTLIGSAKCASFTLDGSLYAAGGFARNAFVKRYDVDSDTWRVVANMLTGRDGFGAITIRSAGAAEEQDLFDSLIAKTSNVHS